MNSPIELTLLDIHFAELLVRLDGRPDEGLWWGAALTSNAAGQGHSCLPLAEFPEPRQLAATSHRHAIPPTPQAWRDLLQQSPCVGQPGEFTPLILDHHDRLYLHRNWCHEEQIATALAGRTNEPFPDSAALAAALDSYFPPSDGKPDQQRIAAHTSLTRRFSVISGGPGTGKTATVARILALLAETTDTEHILLAAPTGKAALRLHQSIHQAAERLKLPEELRARLPDKVSTIHRLLGMQPHSGRFRYHEEHRLRCDLLIVDEASMVDLHLMAALLQALPPACRVILLGDRHQLASVEAGAVLADICDAAESGIVPVTQLSKSYRFHDNSGIAALARLINAGDADAVMELLGTGSHPDVIWQPLPEGTAFERAFTATAAQHLTPFNRAATPADALAALDSFKVLTPLRSGPYGVETLNRYCAATRKPARHAASHHPAEPIMVTGNNYELELFNGDTGVIIADGDTEAAWFTGSDGALRRLSTFRLPPCEAAFALTVHKSQGSEYDQVLLILPEQPTSLLTRELLYTAVTRARQQVVIWGSEAALRQAVSQQTRRYSGLTSHLAEAARRE